MEANNIRAMRDALTETQSVIKKCMKILNRIPSTCGYDGLIEDVTDELCGLRDDFVNPALAAPPRNCDVGTAEEQSERCLNFCHNYPKCTGCPCVGRIKYGQCEFAWAQLPYEAKEGGNNVV